MLHFYEDNANKIIPGLFRNYLASQSSKFIDNNKIKAIVNLTPDFQIHLIIKLII